MSARYEVELDLQATVWIDVEADSAEEAIADAKAAYNIGDVQWHEVVDASAKLYAEGAA